MADVSPKFIILAVTNTGNHPFSHIAKSSGERDEKVVLSIDALKEVILDYRETFVGKIFVGRRSGFFDEQDEKLKALEAEGLIVYKPVNEAVDLFVDQFSKQMK